MVNKWGDGQQMGRWATNGVMVNKWGDGQQMG
jgi:hypothetical protein